MPYLRPKTFLNLPPKLHPVVFPLPTDNHVNSPLRRTTFRGYPPADDYPVSQGSDRYVSRCEAPERCWKRVTEISRNKRNGQEMYDIKTTEPFSPSLGNYDLNEHYGRPLTTVNSQPYRTEHHPFVVPDRSYPDMVDGGRYQREAPFYRPPPPVNKVAHDIFTSSPSTNYRTRKSGTFDLPSGMPYNHSSRYPYSQHTVVPAMFENMAYPDEAVGQNRMAYSFHESTPAEEYQITQPYRVPRTSPRGLINTMRSVPTPQVLNPLIQEVAYEDDVPGGDLTGVYSPSGSHWPPPRMELFYMPPDDYPMSKMGIASLKSAMSTGRRRDSDSIGPSGPQRVRR